MCQKRVMHIWLELYMWQKRYRQFKDTNWNRTCRKRGSNQKVPPYMSQNVSPFWYASILCISIYLDDEGRTKKQNFEDIFRCRCKKWNERIEVEVYNSFYLLFIFSTICKIISVRFMIGWSKEGRKYLLSTDLFYVLF